MVLIENQIWQSKRIYRHGRHNKIFDLLHKKWPPSCACAVVCCRCRFCCLRQIPLGSELCRCANAVVFLCLFAAVPFPACVDVLEAVARMEPFHPIQDALRVGCWIGERLAGAFILFLVYTVLGVCFFFVFFCPPGGGGAGFHAF